MHIRSFLQQQCLPDYACLQRSPEYAVKHLIVGAHACGFDPGIGGAILAFWGCSFIALGGALVLVTSAALLRALDS